MSKLKHDILLRSVKLSNAIIITTIFAVCWFCYYSDRISYPFYKRGNYLIILLYFVIYIIVGRLYEAFVISMHRITEMVYAQFLSVGITNGITYIVIWLLSKKLPAVFPLLAVFVCQLVADIIWSKLAQWWYFRTFPTSKMAIVYDRYKGINDMIRNYGLNRKYDVRLKIRACDCLKNLDSLKGMKTVFLSGVHSHDRNIILKYCIANGIDVLVIPRIGDVIMSGAYPMHVFHLPVLRVGRYMVKPEYLFIKRVSDIVISVVALVLLSPVMLITTIAIKAEDRGPALYKQIRLTKDGKKFEILKFRSMRVDAEKDGVARLSTGENDDRITSVGRVIRRFRIDELPQLINIIRGDLSICGPRPERPEIAEKYCKEMPEFELRLQAKAGLTGYAQVYGKYNTNPYDKLQMDLMYIAHPSIFEDLKIMLTTVKILFKAESTEGIEEENTDSLTQGEKYGNI